MRLEEAIIALADAHIRRFENLLCGDRPGVNRQECEYQLRIWSDIWNERGKVELLTSRERSEVQEAILCGSYAELLAPFGVGANTRLPPSVVVIAPRRDDEGEIDNEIPF